MYSDGVVLLTERLQVQAPNKRKTGSSSSSSRQRIRIAALMNCERTIATDWGGKQRGRECVSNSIASSGDSAVLPQSTHSTQSTRQFFAVSARSSLVRRCLRPRNSRLIIRLRGAWLYIKQPATTTTTVKTRAREKTGRGWLLGTCMDWWGGETAEYPLESRRRVSYIGWYVTNANRSRRDNTARRAYSLLDVLRSVGTVYIYTRCICLQS